MKIINVTQKILKERMYIFRNQKVMLDFDLAEIYGYETKYFNRQIKNNYERFEGSEFMFRLTRAEVENLVRCKKCTSRRNLFLGQSGGSRYLPNAFTEQGIYMLMTVLKGDLAISQSRSLIRLFKQMKDYLIESRVSIDQKELTHDRAVY